MHRLARQAAAAAVAAVVSMPVAAITVFSDDFDANTPGINRVPTGWTVTQGSVDIIGIGTIADHLPGNGLYIDLDGTTGDAGKLGLMLNLSGGVAYRLQFDLAGSQRGTGDDMADVVFGTAVASYSLPGATGFTTYRLGFTPATNGLYEVSFEGRGGDNIGLLLDRVQVTAVPEPQAWALMALGLLGLAGISRGARRRPG